MSVISNLWKQNRVAVISSVIMVLLGLFNLKQCSDIRYFKKKAEVAEHNLNVANDSIRIVKDEAGKIEYDKLAFWTNKLANLEKLNKDLAAEVKKIKGKVATIISGTIVIKDTVEVPLIVHGELIDSTVRADFKFDTTYSPGNYRKLSGFTKFNLRNGVSSGSLLQDELSMRFSTGIKNIDKGKPEIFIKSDYPGFSVSSLDGAVIDPKLFNIKDQVKLLTIGIGVGWVPLTYDFKTRKTDFNIQRFGVSAGVNINLLKLLKPNQ